MDERKNQNTKKRRICLVIFSSTFLIVGLLLYLILNRTAWISKMFFSLIALPTVNVSDNNLIRIIRNYGADLLWSAAFTMMVQATIYIKKRKIWILLFCSALGILYELMQYVGVAIGTADIVDVIVYIIGCIISILIILGGKMYEI